MTKEIIENNKLIAEFMQLQLTNNGWYDNEETLIHLTDLQNGDNTWDTLHFHESFDWLMPVIDRLQNVTEEPEELDYLKDTMWWGTISDIYKEVIECINEYNKKE